MIAVLAGTVDQFRWYIKDQKLKPSDVRCILKAEHLVGREFSEYRTIGTWHDHDSELLNMWEFYRRNYVKP